MLAYSTGMPIAFDPGLTVLSVAIAMGLRCLGFATALAFGGAVGGMIAGFAIAARVEAMAATRLSPSSATCLAEPAVSYQLWAASLRSRKIVRHWASAGA